MRFRSVPIPPAFPLELLLSSRVRRTLSAWLSKNVRRTSVLPTIQRPLSLFQSLFQRFGQDGHRSVLSADISRHVDGQSVGLTHCLTSQQSRAEPGRERVAGAHRVGDLHFRRLAERGFPVLREHVAPVRSERQDQVSESVPRDQRPAGVLQIDARFTMTSSSSFIFSTLHLSSDRSITSFV